MSEGIFSFFLENFGITTVMIITVTYALSLLVTNLPKIIDSITYFQSRRIKHINEALNSEWVDDNYKKVLKKEISRLYLSGTLKIKASEREVKEIIKLSNITEERFNILELHHAVKNIKSYFYNYSLDELKNENIRIEKSRRPDFLMLFSFFVFLPFIAFLFLKDPINYSNTMIILRKYHAIFPVILVVLFIANIILIITSLKEKSNVIRVLKYFIHSLEGD